MDLYEIYKNKLSVLESSFDDNKNESLKLMSDLYLELEKTNFHDLSDSIEIWVYEEGNEELLEYLRSLNNNIARQLFKILDEKINN